MARDMVALLDHLKFNKVVFAGSDIGGNIVQKLAWYYPGSVASLVIFNNLIMGTMMHRIHYDKGQHNFQVLGKVY